MRDCPSRSKRTFKHLKERLKICIYNPIHLLTFIYDGKE